jgi:hypothetical protein
LFGRGWYIALFSWYKLCNKYCARIVKTLIRGPNLDLVSGCDLDQVHVGIRENHTCKKIWSVVAIWSILIQIFLAIKWHQYLLFICRLVIFTYQPHHTSTIPSGLNSNPHRHAAVAVVRPVAAAQEAKEGLTPAAGKETEASRRPRRRRWRHGPVPQRGVRGRERHLPRRTGRASTHAGRRTAASAPPATAATPGLVAIGGGGRQRCRRQRRPPPGVVPAPPPAERTDSREGRRKRHPAIVPHLLPHHPLRRPSPCH